MKICSSYLHRLVAKLFYTLVMIEFHVSEIIEV